MKRSLIASLLVLAALCRAHSTEPPSSEAATGEQLSFVQMCDTQLGMGGYEHDVKTFTLAVEQINRMKPDFVVICGDLVGKANEQSWLDFNRIKSGFVIPCHCAAGNHDVGNAPTALSLKLYREKVGKDYFAVEHKGFTFVVANTQLWKAPLKGESEKHEAWFKETLGAAKKKGRPIVVVVHYPLLADVPADLSANAAVRHQKLTGRVVGPVMAVEVVSAVALSVAPPGGQWQAWLLIALVLLLVALGVTIFVSVPLHAKMAAGQTGPVTQRLVLSNWIRTTAWSGRTILLTLLVIRAV